MSKNYTELTPFEFFKRCLHVEVVRSNHDFTWGRVIRRYYRNPHIRYQLKWRFAAYLHARDTKSSKKLAAWINRRLQRTYNVEIMLGAFIAPGLRIAHHCGIVVNDKCRIGENFHIHQNTTIGSKKGPAEFIIIGDNVTIGAHSCIIGHQLTIGHNVTIGAATFLNKDVPDNVTYFTKRESVAVEKVIELNPHLSIESAYTAQL